MKVTFIHHSSFCVELTEHVLVFDYFRGDRIPEFRFSGEAPKWGQDKKVCVFSSHQHGDHFDPVVLTWARRYPKIQYVFSKDIRLGERYLERNGIDPEVKEKVYFMKPNSRLSLDGLEIETLLSTDEGVAFLVTVEEKTIFHAGDLNWWHWEEEEAAFNQYQEKTFQRQIDKLKDRRLDLAFVVIDQRLGQAAYWGADYFMEHVNAEHVIPMHLWQNYDLALRYQERPKSAAFRERIEVPERENQVFEF